MNKMMLTLLACALVVGCQPTTTVKKSTSSSSSSSGFNNGGLFPTPTPVRTATPSPTTGTTQSYCYAEGVGNQSIKYYTIYNVIGKGSEIWTTKGVVDNKKLLFDSRLNVRLVARPSPAQSDKCKMIDMPYTKLQADVSVRKIGTTDSPSQLIRLSAKVNECSDVAVFDDLPQGTAFAQIDISNVQWDYGCNGNTPSDGTQHACPFYPVLKYDCWQFDLQFSTDYTTDMPR